MGALPIGRVPDQACSACWKYGRPSAGGCCAHALARPYARSAGGGFTALRAHRRPTGDWGTVFARGEGDDPPAVPTVDGARPHDTIVLGRFHLTVVEASPAGDISSATSPPDRTRS